MERIKELAPRAVFNNNWRPSVCCWKALLQNLGNYFAAGRGTEEPDLLQRTARKRRPQHLELRSNDFNPRTKPMRESGIRLPTTGGVTQQQFTKHLYTC